jgi:hypothetical protein
VGFKSSIGFKYSKNIQEHIPNVFGQILIYLFIYLFFYMHVYECYVVFLFIFLHTSIKGFPFVTSEFYLSFSSLGVTCSSHCRRWIAFMYIHLMDKVVHSPYAIEMALMTTFPFVETIFFINGCYISTSTIIGYKTQLSNK